MFPGRTLGLFAPIFDKGWPPVWPKTKLPRTDPNCQWAPGISGSLDSETYGSPRSRCSLQRTPLGCRGSSHLACAALGTLCKPLNLSATLFRGSSVARHSSLREVIRILAAIFGGSQFECLPRSQQLSVITAFGKGGRRCAWVSWAGPQLRSGLWMWAAQSQRCLVVALQILTAWLIQT